MPNFHLPRFIIQPLLENCFAHGFHNKEFPWKIDIQIYCSEDCWEVQIRDNGCGMDQEELEKLELELLEMRNRDVKSLMKELKIGGLTIKMFICDYFWLMVII
ncbi:MAG: sensor histidine kinase [Blautia sp.]